MANQFRTYYGEYSLKHWIRMILSGEIALPPYQRHFVWNPEMVFKLLNNISKDLFVPPVILSSFSGDKKNKPTTYVLDGQQRLSAILITFLGLYPQKFDEFKSELANEENLNSETETFDDEERDKFLIWNFQEIQELYKEQGIGTPDDLRIALEKSKKYIKINANIRNNLKDKEKLSEETLSEFLLLQIDDDFVTSDDIENMLNKETIEIEKTSKSGKTSIVDIKPLILSWSWVNKENKEFVVDLVTGSNENLRPDTIIKLFGDVERYKIVREKIRIN